MPTKQPSPAKELTQLTLDRFFRPIGFGSAHVEGAEDTYVKISNNIGKYRQAATSTTRCGCSIDCLERCRNWRRHIECDRSTCTRSLCSNRRWAQCLLDPVELQLRRVPGKGMGAFAAEPITSGSIIREYVGEIITKHEKERRELVRPSIYMMEYVSGLYIDAGRYGNIARFFNHSCDPNSRAEEWLVSGEYRIGIAAARDIPAGEEVTFDYGDEFFLESCLCSKCEQ